ncbi:MAG: 8-oxo-dGTP diphosphatase [Patescibacteria group bacterium]
MKKILTLCLIQKNDKILLGMKKRGFGEGRWNGFGGKVEENESIEEATKREFLEESGITVNNLEKMGIMEFIFHTNLEEILEVHIFKSEDFSGELIESEEMKPQWFHIKEIPFNDMWPDDEHWIPLFLENKKFKGKFLFGEGDSILEKTLEEVLSIN